MGRIIKRGEIHWYHFKSPDKKRPVLILTRDSIMKYLGEVTIAPITTTIRNIPSEVLLLQEDGVPQESAINLDHIQTVSKGKIGAFLTSISQAKLDQVKKAIDFALGF